MMTKLAVARNFSHLLGIGAAAKRRAEDDKPEREEERDEDRQPDDEEKEDKDAKGSSSTRRAESEEHGDDGEEEEDHEDGRAKRGKKTSSKRRAESDDEDEDEDDEEGDDETDEADMRRRGSRAARMRERARCAAIFSDKAAAKNPALAASLAFNTSLPRREALAVLRAGGSGARAGRLDDLMSGVSVPNPGPSAPPQSGQASLADKIIAAGKKARGEA